MAYLAFITFSSITFAIILAFVIGFTLGPLHAAVFVGAYLLGAFGFAAHTVRGGKWSK